MHQRQELMSERLQHQLAAAPASLSLAPGRAALAFFLPSSSSPSPLAGRELNVAESSQPGYNKLLLVLAEGRGEGGGLGDLVPE